MGPRKTIELKKALTGKGFKKQDTHHEMYWLYIDGKKSAIRTRISHGVEEYGDSLLGQMSRQLKLRRKDFDDLIDCPLTEEGYREKLRQDGIAF